MNAQRIVFCFVLLLALATLGVKAQRALVTVKIIINGTGTGSVTRVSPTVNCSSSCSVQVPAASTLALHATAANGSSFLMWTGECSGVTDCNLSDLRADKTVTATFSPATAQLKLAILGGGVGSITISPPNDLKFACTRGSSNCLQTLPKGNVVHLKAVAGGDSFFSEWSGTGTNPCPATAADCEFTLNESVDLSAGFGWKVPHTILQVTTAGTSGGVGGRIFSSTPEGAIDCSLTCQASFPKDQAVQLLAVPDASSSFAGWSDGGGGFISQFCSIQATCDLPVGAGTVRATFKPNPLGPVPKAFLVGVSPPDAGYFEINPKPDCTNTGCSNYTSLAPISIQAFNKPGYEFKNWSSKTGFPCKQTGSYLDSNCSFTLNGTYDVIANYVTIASISADLQTSLQTPSSVAALEEFQVTATLFNAGPIEASKVALTLNLPGGVNLVSANSSAGVCQGGNSFSCTITGLPSGSSISIGLTLRAPSNSGKLDWRASGGSPTPSTITDNNIATASTQVMGGTTLSLSAIKPTNSPADGTALKGASEVPMLAFKLTPSGAETFTLNSLLLKTSGTGRGFKDYLEVHLYQDTNQNAQVDTGEQLVASTNFEAENPSGLFLMYSSSAIDSAGSSYLVTVNFNSTLAAGHFSSLGFGFAGLVLLGLSRRKWRGLALGLLLSSALVSCPDPPAIQDLRTYQISLIETRVTAASQTITTTGLPLTGTTISVAK
jgi:hypothetical protein